MNERSLRILFVTEEYPPDAGGVATSAQRVARNLTRLGHHVVIFCFDNSQPTTAPSYVRREQDERVTVQRIGPFFRKIHGPSADDEETRSIIRRRVFDVMEHEALAFRPHVILSFFAGNAGWFGTYLGRSLGVPHVAGIRGLDAGQYIFSLKHLSLLHLITQSADRIVCVNTHLRLRLLLAFPELAGKTGVIHNAVELSPAAGMTPGREYRRAVAHWPDTAVVAVFIGSPREKKGTTALIEALRLARTQADVRLLVVGSDFRAEDRARCGPTIDALQAEHALHVTGHRTRAEAVTIAAEGDLVVMPSLDDGLPNGLLEGMALGLCPIVSDLFADVVTADQDGWVVRRDDPAALSRAFVEAARSPEQRARFGAAAKALVATRHAPVVEASAYERVFRDLVP